MAEFNIYVIELDKKVLEKKKFLARNPSYNPTKPCVYIGQTAKTPEERFEQHKNGVRSNTYAREFGKYLRPRQYEKYNPLATRKKAEAKEKWLAERLQKKGYGVWWN